MRTRSGEVEREPVAHVVVEPHAEVRSLADDVWLPIRFEGDRPVIEWLDEWSPADFA
ncbi:hypothetical protein JOD63_000025 [Microbacterium terrae]|uniref:hypothetical protein n=1 Tax=Microbacterium terrae TaxID=69369 RepID=UPI000B16435F|nr:hypothetical protein [Microbacterium terrae]MBP1076057.1 hypothetical protein [Microbacterium terrae]GLJ96877.1 hypothetical protein GCM10017594_00740 [Microbacterium terrae]